MQRGGEQGDETNKRVIDQSTVGNTYCTYGTMSFGSNSTPRACVHVPYDYHYTPPPGVTPPPGSQANKDKTGPQTWINDQQPTASCKNLATGDTQANCLSLTSSSGVSTISYQFNHAVTNFGPTRRKTTSIWINHNDGWDNSTRKISGLSYNSDDSINWPVDSSDSDISGLKDTWLSGSYEASQTATFAKDGGKIWCANINVVPGGYTNDNPDPSSIQSISRCAHIPYNYEISVQGSGTVTTDTAGNQSCSNITQVGTIGSLNYTVKASSDSILNGSSATQSLPIYYRVMDGTSVIVGKTLVPTGSGDGVLTPGESSNQISVSVPPHVAADGIANYVLEISDDGVNWGNTTSPVITKQDTSTNHVSSGSSCTAFAKSPSAQLNGADSRANGTVGTTDDSFSGGYTGTATDGSLSGSQLKLGSWGQYGLLANSGKIDQFGATDNIANDTGTCKLWFANIDGAPGTDCSSTLTGQGKLGMNPTFSRNLPAIPTSFVNTGSPSPTGNTIDPGLQYKKDGWYGYNSDIKIQGSYYNLEDNTLKAVIYVAGNVEIKANIRSITSNYTSLADMPSLTIIATGDINIDHGVSEIDANLISTTKTVNDCSDSSDFAENGGCSTQLQINGAISTANTPHLTRTYGGEDGGSASDACDGGTVVFSTPAECVNYTPNLFLVPYYDSLNGDNGDSIWHVVNQVSLPARY